MKVVLDASAILAYLQGEPGADVVARHIETAVVSTVNFCEVISRLVDQGIAALEIDAMLAEISLEVTAFDADHALVAGHLRLATRRRGLSLGDRACLALAQARGLPALTADRAWADVDAGVEVRVIR